VRVVDNLELATDKLGGVVDSAVLQKAQGGFVHDNFRTILLEYTVSQIRDTVICLNEKGVTNVSSSSSNVSDNEIVYLNP